MIVRQENGNHKVPQNTNLVMNSLIVNSLIGSTWGLWLNWKTLKKKNTRSLELSKLAVKADVMTAWNKVWSGDTIKVLDCGRGNIFKQTLGNLCSVRLIQWRDARFHSGATIWLVYAMLMMLDMSLKRYQIVTFSVWEHRSLITNKISHYLFVKRAKIPKSSQDTVSLLYY